MVHARGTLCRFLKSLGNKAAQGRDRELLRCAQVLFFIQQAGLINEIFGEDCAMESQMEKLEELLQCEHGIIALPCPVRMRLV